MGGLKAGTLHDGVGDKKRAWERHFYATEYWLVAIWVFKAHVLEMGASVTK